MSYLVQDIPPDLIEAYDLLGADAVENFDRLASMTAEEAAAYAADIEADCEDLEEDDLGYGVTAEDVLKLRTWLQTVL
jgi:hypothetical protein